MSEAEGLGLRTGAVDILTTTDITAETAENELQNKGERQYSKFQGSIQ